MDILDRLDVVATTSAFGHPLHQIKREYGLAADHIRELRAMVAAQRELTVIGWLEARVGTWTLTLEEVIEAVRTGEIEAVTHLGPQRPNTCYPVWPLYGPTCPPAVAGNGSTGTNRRLPAEIDQAS